MDTVQTYNKSLAALITSLLVWVSIGIQTQTWDVVAVQGTLTTLFVTIVVYALRNVEGLAAHSKALGAAGASIAVWVLGGFTTGEWELTSVTGSIMTTLTTLLVWLIPNVANIPVLQEHEAGSVTHGSGEYGGGELRTVIYALVAAILLVVLIILIKQL